MAAGWKYYFLELKDADIRGPDRELHETSEGQFRQSWIWTVSPPKLNPSAPTPPEAQPSAANPTFLQPPTPSASTVIPGMGVGGPAVNEKEQRQSQCAHWSRAQARAERYEEKVKLTVEEMGRTLKYFKWKKSWWESISSDRARSNNPPPPDVQDGLHAYACRQSYIYDQLITLFVNHWRGFLSVHSLGSYWLCDYPLDIHPAPPARPHRGHRRLDETHSDITNPPQQPATSSETTDPTPGYSAAPQKSVAQQEAPILTSDDNTEAPLDDGLSEEDSDDDLMPNDLWDDDSDDDDSDRDD